ncbi:MAG TPA: hypothetical protein VE646_09820 [Actinomycetota bacterium]|nr:hypothetical protein [Actinomycetota bacterium]
MAKTRRGAGTRRRKAGKRGDGPSPQQIRDAVERARGWLSERRDYYGYLARQSSRRGAPEMGGHLRGDILARQDPDGSWGGDLAATAEAAWQLLDLGMSPDAPALRRALDWLYTRRDAGGAYAEGCTPARHEQGVCEHYLTGFFSPGAADEPQEIALPNGQSISSDASARLLASERALRTVLRIKPDDLRARDSVSGLRGVPLYLDYGGTFTPALLVGAVQALTWSPGPPSGELTAGLDTLASHQVRDGTWPNVEFFFVLETLLEAPPARALPMFERALPYLLKAQYNNGAWGRRYQAAQTWIGLQVLERVAAARRAAKLAARSGATVR